MRNSQSSLTGSFFGTYNLHAKSLLSSASNTSYFSVSWKKKHNLSELDFPSYPVGIPKLSVAHAVLES
jgi:hypothetical protein